MFLINHMWDFIIAMGRGDFLKTYILTFIGILFSVFLTYRLKVSAYDSSNLFYAIIVCVIGAICVSQFFLCGMRRIVDLKWCSPLFYPVDDPYDTSPASPLFYA